MLDLEEITDLFGFFAVESFFILLKKEIAVEGRIILVVAQNYKK